MDANSKAWKNYFERTDALIRIEQDGHCIVTSTELKTHTGREPRLLAKLDTLSSVPQIFRQHHLAILPIHNGRYLLFKDEARRGYFRFSDENLNTEVEQYTSKVDLLKFDAFPGTGVLNESQVIDFAHISSLLSHFTGDKDLHLVIRGRQYSKGFEFNLLDNPLPIRVSSVQIEIDAGYESEHCIYLLEAKIGKRDDFNIRQLFYPYLEWSNRTQKEVRTIFLTYTNGKFLFTEFKFDKQYGSLEIRNNRGFTVNESPRPDISIAEIVHQVIAGPEPLVPYPQADDLDKVVDLIKLVAEGVTNYRDIANFFEFDIRQAQYYSNAARYLDLLTIQNRDLALSEFGENFLSIRSRGERTKRLFAKTLERPTFRQSLHLWVQQEHTPSGTLRHEITQLLATMINLSPTTANRRASTVLSWLRWFHNNANLMQ